MAGKKALRDTEKLVLDLHRHKRVDNQVESRVSKGKGPAGIIGSGHEPGTPPFRLSSKNCHSGKGFVLSVRQIHNLCSPVRSSWVAKESWVSILCGSDSSLTMMVGFGGSEAAIIRLKYFSYRFLESGKTRCVAELLTGACGTCTTVISFGQR